MVVEVVENVVAEDAIVVVVVVMEIWAPSSGHRLFMRCDVNFDISTQGRNLNTFIGWAANIEFLESDVFARRVLCFWAAELNAREIFKMKKSKSLAAHEM
ncbi:hypothetical protein RHMOL_Rhmol01G0263700 [Rhododendron molle]|uniref:Uncharacterized protein n=1 Tax=Rhododendron molle TaxID=49168 RepID=A0ACC0Q690_RHOML|nr:hypothetical protein RHMOL_Rhmol01G0263700 [Rhododendron molle]